MKEWVGYTKEEIQEGLNDIKKFVCELKTGQEEREYKHFYGRQYEEDALTLNRLTFLIECIAQTEVERDKLIAQLEQGRE